MNRSRGVVVATLVAGLFTAQGCRTVSEEAAGPTKAPSDRTTASSKKAKCAGINECRGKGACSTASNSCAGKNECKGKAWIEVESEKFCTDKGGTLVTVEMPMDDKGS